MGILDDARRMREMKAAQPELSNAELVTLLEAEKHRQRATAHSAHFVPGFVAPYVEKVPAKVFGRDLDAFVIAYLGIVGLQPEDVFAIYTEPRYEDVGPLSIIYRDRPAYAAGRQRYRQVVLGE